MKLMHILFVLLASIGVCNPAGTEIADPQTVCPFQQSFVSTNFDHIFTSLINGNNQNSDQTLSL